MGTTMRARGLLLAAILLTAGLAGCTGEDDPSTGDAPSDNTSTEPANASPADETDEPEPDAGPNVSVEWFNGTIRGVSPPVLGPACVVPCDNHVWDVEVPNGTSAIVAEMAWNASASMLFDVDPPPEECEFAPLQDCAPDSQTGNEGRLEIRVQPPDEVPAGSWETAGWAEDRPVEPVEFTIAVSLFEGDPVPSDYAKLGSPQ